LGADSARYRREFIDQPAFSYAGLANNQSEAWARCLCGIQEIAERLNLFVPSNKLITQAHDGTGRDRGICVSGLIEMKSIPAAPVRDNDLRIGRAVAECASRCRDRDSQRTRGNHSPLPNSVEELLFANYTIAVC